MSDQWEMRAVGPRIHELAKSTLPAGLADPQGAYPFYCSSPDVKRIDRVLTDMPAVMMGTGGLASVHYASEPFAYSTDTWAFTSRDAQTDLRFLYRQFERLLPKIDFLGFGGSGLRHLSKDFIRQMVLPSPSPEVQSKIARVLDTLDAAIVQTEAIIAKLKAVKQGLLHDLLTRGIDANGELRPLQSEAPQLYKQSAMGWIPGEWKIGALRCWLADKPRNGYSPQEAGEWTGVQMLGLGCLTNEGFEPVQLKPAPRGDKRLATVMLADGDLLMSRSNTRDLVGLAGVYRDVGTSCTYPDLMMRLRTSPETSGEFMQFVLRSPRLRRQIQANAVGTSGSMVKISGRIVCDLLTAMPLKAEQERILSCLAAGNSTISAEAERSLVLRDLKSGLMDDLLTGRVRVAPLLAEAETERECA